MMKVSTLFIFVGILAWSSVLMLSSKKKGAKKGNNTNILYILSGYTSKNVGYFRLVPNSFIF